MTNQGYDKVLTPKMRSGRPVPIEPMDLLVVDEVGMMDSTLFNRLMDAFHEGTIGQLLLMGDLLQLPPIGGQPDLHSLPATFIELTEQMRQAESSPQLKDYFKELRSAIQTNSFFDPIQEDVPEFTYIDSHKEFAQAYKDCEDDKLVIMYRNNKVTKYNSNIHTSQTFEEGDVVILDKPLGKAANQTSAIIKEVIDYEPTHYKLLLENVHGEEHEVFHFTHKQTLIDQLERFKVNKDYKGFHKAQDKCFDLKYGYSVTTTKSQGSSVSHVFIDLDDIISAYTQKKTKFNFPITLNAHLRFIYVSISRMRTHCTMFTGNKRDYPKFNPKDK